MKLTVKGIATGAVFFCASSGPIYSFTVNADKFQINRLMCTRNLRNDKNEEIIFIKANNADTSQKIIYFDKWSAVKFRQIFYLNHWVSEEYNFQT